MPDVPPPLTLHATSVAVEGVGVLIRGASGSGKSTLALQLMAYGAALVSDDQTIVTPRGTGLEMSAPEPLRGLIEARGLGILNAEPGLPAQLAVVVDLDQQEPMRLPPQRKTTLLGHTFPLLHPQGTLSFAAGLLQFLKYGRNA